MSLNKTRKRSIAKSKRNLARHKRKKIDNVIKEFSNALSISAMNIKTALKLFYEALNDKK